MKSSVLVCIGVALITVSAWAGPETIIKQRAKEQVNQSNVRQGVAPPTQQPVRPAATPGTAATPVAVSPYLTRFQTDLAAIQQGSTPTAAQKQKLVEDLNGLAQAAKPTPAVATKLSEELASAVAEKPLPSSSRARLAQELDAVLNPAKYPQAKMDGIYADVQAIFQENGCSRNKAVAVSEQVKALRNDIQNGGAR